MSNVLENALTWITTALLGGIVYLIRVVFTNQKQIEMLQAEMRYREQLRNEDREQMAEIYDELREVKSLLMRRS